MALGSVAPFLLLIMIPVGFHVVLVKTQAGLKTIDAAGFNLTTLTLGFALAFVGLAARKRPFIHKRLMMVATMVLTVAAADRVALVFGLGDVRLFRKLLAVVWLDLWFVASDALFMRPAGEVVVRALTRVFVW